MHFYFDVWKGKCYNKKCTKRILIHVWLRASQKLDLLQKQREKIIYYQKWQLPLTKYLIKWIYCNIKIQMW